MVKRGFRDANVYQLDPNKFDNQIKKVVLDGLIFLPILRSKRYSGYGHRHYPTDIIDQDTFIYGVIAKDKATAIRFHDAGVVDLSKRIGYYPTQGIDHDATGEMLGYPKCDRDFFSHTWLKDGCLDPMFETAMNTSNIEVVTPNEVKVGGHTYLNRLIRYFGFGVIPYFPHSFDCKPSIDFAVKWFNIMREYDEEAADACVCALNQPMTWSLNNCIIYVEHPLFIGSANGYYTSEERVVYWMP